MKSQLVLYCPKTKEFEREAKKYQKFHGKLAVKDEDLIPYDKFGALRRRWAVLRMLAKKETTYDTVVIFCHGRKNWIELGFTSKDVDILATMLNPILTFDARIILYCCSTGKPGGFAQKLSKAMPLQGLKVYSHLTSGHTTENPFLAIYEDGKDITPYEIMPTGPLWKPWKRSLKNYGKMRLLFPFMTESKLIESLSNAK
jgi:hypothetical protein